MALGWQAACPDFLSAEPLVGARPILCFFLRNNKFLQLKRYLSTYIPSPSPTPLKRCCPSDAAHIRRLEPNTITTIPAVWKRGLPFPEDLVCCHFFFPPHAMPAPLLITPRLVALLEEG